MFKRRKIRQWMIEQNRIETGQCLPLRYEIGGRHKLAFKTGTQYSYMIQYKRFWLENVVQRRSQRDSKRYLINMRINNR